MLHPTTKWAQRKDRIFVEIHLMDITDQNINLTSTHLTFKGESGNKKYGFELELFDQVVAEESKWHKTGFHMFFVLEKKNCDSAFWPRLIKSTQKNQYIQVDWAKWIDEDGEQEDQNKGLGGYDPNQMQQFGGLGGPAGEGQGDEDDEQGQGNIDDLDKQQQIEEANKQVPPAQQP